MTGKAKILIAEDEASVRLGSPFSGPLVNAIRPFLPERRLPREQPA
jgi:hypothetical protein